MATQEKHETQRSTRRFGLALLRLIRSADTPIVTGIIVAGLGLVSSALILKNIIMPPAADAGPIVLLSAKVRPAIGSFLSLIAAVGITLGGVLALRRHHRL